MAVPPLRLLLFRRLLIPITLPSDWKCVLNKWNRSHREKWCSAQLSADSVHHPKDKKEWGAHTRGVSVCAPLSLVHLASLWLVVGGIRLLLAVAQVADDYNSAEHGNGDTVAEILADADGDVHLCTSLPTTLPRYWKCVLNKRCVPYR